MRYSFYCALALVIASFAIISYAYALGSIGLKLATALSSMSLSLLFSLIVFSYLLVRGKTLRDIVDGIGLSRRRLALRYIGLGVVLFLLLLLIEFGAGLFSYLTGMQLPTNVSEVLGGMPIYFYVFSIAIAPLNEEILFRGFMVPRIGILASSAIFAIVHYISYFSYVELAAAFIFGIASSYVFKRTGSLYPSVIGHSLVNLLGIASAFLV